MTYEIVPEQQFLAVADKKQRGRVEVTDDALRTVDRGRQTSVMKP